MDYECGPLQLYSQDKIRMLDFLSDVFEFDVDTVADCVFRGPLFLKLCEEEGSTPGSAKNMMVFNFKVKSEQEIKEIISKYNFFLYRKSNLCSVSEELDLVQDEKKKILTISDIDQRLWRFIYEPSFSME